MPCIAARNTTAMKGASFQTWTRMTASRAGVGRDKSDQVCPGQPLNPDRQQPKLIVEQPAKDVAGDDGRDGPRNQVDRARERPASKIGVEKLCDHHPHDQVEEGRGDDEHDREYSAPWTP